MIKTIFFTKNRPMQFRACIESFNFATGWDLTTSTVICNDPENYKDIQDDYEYQLIDDSKIGFDTAIRSFVESMDDNDLFLPVCDDMVFTRFYHPTAAATVFETPEAEKMLGFSLRLGWNINPLPVDCQIKSDPRFFAWEWRQASGHYNVPFELMHTMYKASFVKEIVRSNKDEMKCPNFLESYGNNYCINNVVAPYMVMFRAPNFNVAFDINRCQDYFPNKIQGGEGHSTEELSKLYKEGFRLAWEVAWESYPKDIFVGDKYLMLKKQ
jgi:hypothetical protein